MLATPRLLLALLAVMGGQAEGVATCSDNAGNGNYELGDAKCWSPDINGLFGGKLNGCIFEGGPSGNSVRIRCTGCGYGLKSPCIAD